jgi:hypothetical protein
LEIIQTCRASEEVRRERGVRRMREWRGRKEDEAHAELATFRLE